MEAPPPVDSAGTRRRGGRSGPGPPHPAPGGGSGQPPLLHAGDGAGRGGKVGERWRTERGDRGASGSRFGGRRWPPRPRSSGRRRRPGVVLGGGEAWPSAVLPLSHPGGDARGRGGGRGDSKIHTWRNAGVSKLNFKKGEYMLGTCGRKG